MQQNSEITKYKFKSEATYMDSRLCIGFDCDSLDTWPLWMHIHVTGCVSPGKETQAELQNKLNQAITDSLGCL